jgi:hypothetical protein
MTFDILSPDNGGDSVPIYSVRRGDSQAHSLPMSAPGSHHPPALCAAPWQVLFLLNVFTGQIVPYAESLSNSEVKES